MKTNKFQVNRGEEPHSDDGKHHLGDVKGVSPIVVRHVAVILLHAQQPAAEDLVFDVEPADKIQVEKHPQASLHSTALHVYSITRAHSQVSKCLPFILVIANTDL